ncbi:MAG: ABC transporter permease [Rhizobiaceae bacterium]|nr:ABC transporter permease [Rhizobiaceae bacterium]
MKREATTAVVLLVLMVVAAILAAGANPLLLVAGIAERALFTRAGLLEALLRTIPLTVMGLGITIAFRARVFNIGMDGQLIAGSVVAVALAPLLPANAAGIALFLLLGVLGGALWGGIAGLIKARYGGNEIIVTIMLNYIAIQLLSWLVRGPLQESMRIIPRTDSIDKALRLPIIFEGTRIHLGLVIAAAMIILVAVLVRRSRFGFKLDVVGANEHAARYAGIDPRRIAGLVLLVSGAFAGLAGAVEISGLYGRLQEGFAPGFGITAIAVALVARLNPLLVPLAAFLFSLLYVGLGALARNGVVPFPLINILEGTVILLFLAGSVAFSRRRKVAEATDG